ncbi:unnamed protein product, partial [Sphacelaria rigidula]
HGLPVDCAKLREAKRWAWKQENPISGEVLADSYQVKEDLLKKGVDVDRVTEALLKGANPEDGGGVGIAFQCIGNGDCFMNAVATLIIAKSRRGDRRKAILRLARKLRPAIVITGIKYME